jgi:hypothetical protein
MSSLTRRERTILRRKIVEASKYAVAEAINRHKALGVGIIVWSEKKKGPIYIPASKIKKKRLKKLI